MGVEGTGVPVARLDRSGLVLGYDLIERLPKHSAVHYGARRTFNCRYKRETCVVYCVQGN